MIERYQRFFSLGWHICICTFLPACVVFTSGGDPSLFLFRAISLPPAKKDDTDIGAFPETLMFTAPLREAQIHADVAKCWAEIPEGPAVVDVPLRKDHRIGESMLNVVLSE